MARPRPLADLIGTCLGAVLAKQGFASADIIASWPDIVGERLATFSQPLKIEWRKRASGASAHEKSEPASLIIRVESAFALEIQHSAPILIERINAFYGWRCIGRIVLKQGPVGKRLKKSKPATICNEETRRKIMNLVGDMAEEPLKEALIRLGQNVLAGKDL